MEIWWLGISRGDSRVCDLPPQLPKNLGWSPPPSSAPTTQEIGLSPHFTPLFCPKNVDFVIFDPLMGNPGFSQEGVIFFIHFTEISLHYVWSFMRNSVNTIGRLDGTCPSLAKIQLTQACLCFTITWNFLTPPPSHPPHPIPPIPSPTPTTLPDLCMYCIN